MEQLRDLLKQMAMQLELNIAICDMLDSHDKRLRELESSQKALKTRLDGAWTQLNRLATLAQGNAYEDRIKFPESKKL